MVKFIKKELIDWSVTLIENLYLGYPNQTKDVDVLVNYYQYTLFGFIKWKWFRIYAPKISGSQRTVKDAKYRFNAAIDIAKSHIRIRLIKSEIKAQNKSFDEVTEQCQ